MTSSNRTIIESVGNYLPPHEVTTAEIVGGCATPLDMPLERLTGIRTRRRAGHSEFAIDLAHKAIEDCLRRSSFQLGEVEILVSTNISRWDGVNQVFFESPTACRLKQRLGFPSETLTIDISNACAGMWTGVFLIDAMIRSGEIRCGMVVSGEYITHLIDTAQKEVNGFMDSQIASLTLGDAGAAVLLTRGTSPKHGLIDFDLYTLSKYSPFCIAKPTAQSHGGAAMLTDPIRVSEAVIPHAAKHARMILQKNRWEHQHVQHVIPHQTSELTMRAGIREIRSLMNYDFSDRLINNLRHRGNTSSNAHFVALHDAIHEEKIRSGDSVVFCISGSGQSTGTALYVMDDLPERMRQPNPSSRQEPSPNDEEVVLPVQLEIESFGMKDYFGDDEPDTVELLAGAAEICLDSSEYTRQEVDLLIAACTYRSEFIMEPAIAALTAGVLQMNEEHEPEDPHKTFAFDITNGEVGFLKSIYLAAELTRIGRAQKVMVISSEVENNKRRRPEHLLGIRSMASSLMLRESTGDAGFLTFGFFDFAEHADLRKVYAGWHDEGKRVYLTCEDKEDIWPILLDCLVAGTQKFIEKNHLSMDEIRWVLPTQHRSDWMQEFGNRLAIDSNKLIDLDPDTFGNPMTSSLALALSDGLKSGRFRRGDLILIANVSPGIQVGCGLYRI